MANEIIAGKTKREILAIEHPDCGSQEGLMKRMMAGTSVGDIHHAMDNLISGGFVGWLLGQDGISLSSADQ